MGGPDFIITDNDLKDPEYIPTTEMVEQSARVREFIATKSYEPQYIEVNGKQVRYFEQLPLRAISERTPDMLQVNGVPGDPHIYSSDAVVDILDSEFKVRKQVTLKNIKVLTAHGQNSPLIDPNLPRVDNIKAFMTRSGTTWHFGDGTKVVDFVNAYNKLNSSDPIRLLFVCNGQILPGEDTFSSNVIYCLGSEVGGGIIIDKEGQVTTSVHLVTPQLGEWHNLP